MGLNIASRRSSAWVYSMVSTPTATKLAPRQDIFCHRRVDCQKSGRFPRRANAPDALLDHLLHVTMSGIVRVTQRGGEIRRTDKHPVNAVHLKNRVQILQRGSALDLYQQTEFVIRLRHIILYPSPARRSRHASANTAATDGRITGRRDHFPRLLGGIDHRHQQGSGANIQHLFIRLRLPSTGRMTGWLA